MTIKNIYYREHADSYVVIEDDAGALFRWTLGTTRITAAPAEPKAGLLEYDPIMREGMAKGLRAMGHTVLTEGPVTVRSLRMAAGLSQRALADKYGIPRRTIENWESGVRTPPDYVVRLLAAALEAEDRLCAPIIESYDGQK